MKRVKFYSKYDLSCGNNLKLSEEVIQEYEERKRILCSINDAIEIYNINKFFIHKLHLVNWSQSYISRLREVLKVLYRDAAIYLQSINNESIIQTYTEVEFYYTDDFWEIIDKFNIYRNISDEKFQELLNCENIRIHELLRCKKIVFHFGKVIREYMLKNITVSARLLLDIYEVRQLKEIEQLYLPKELSSLDKGKIISDYVDSISPNLNYLRLIENIQSNKDRLEISPKVQLKAKKRADEIESLLIENSDFGVEIETSIAFRDQEEIITKEENEDGQLSLTYSSRWIRENLDFATLLNNFLYLFEYVDLQMRCTLVNKTSEMSVFERYLIMSSQNAYKKGVCFDQKDIIASLQLYGYYRLLFSCGIRLESVIEWFFEQYLMDEFSVKFRVRMPSSEATYWEKCVTIMPALESVLKQFSLFVEEGQINIELLEYRTSQLVYEKIPSLLNKKYVYGKGEEFSTATYLIFSDQSGLSFYNDRSYENLYTLLRNEKVKYSDIPEYNIARIDWLIDRHYLVLNHDGTLAFSNEDLIKILLDLYINEVQSYWRLPTRYRKILDDLETKGIVEFEGRLFSRPEQDYFNYILNKSKFNNGFDLRNKYVHTQLLSIDDEKQHEMNYYIFLRLFIITIIKINDEFCINHLITQIS